MRARRAFLLLALVVGSAVATSGCLSGGLVGEPAPPFSLTTSDGQVVNETTHLGKYLILDMMATWCGPCVLEVAHLREIQQRYPDSVEILSVGVDPNSDTADSLEEFAQEYGASWPHALDADRSLARAYGLSIIPKLVIIGPDGTVVFERQGEVHPAVIARVIDPNAPPEAPGLVLPVLASGLVGFLAAFNPYRRFHRRHEGRADAAVGAAALALVAVLAWLFVGFASSRATYGALLLGAVSLGAAAWWFRARRRDADAREGPLALAGLDRAYEAAPHFALAIALGLDTTGWVAFFSPAAAFLLGMAGGAAARERLPEAQRTTAGLLGLALAGLGLLVFGARILVAQT